MKIGVPAMPGSLSRRSFMKAVGYGAVAAVMPGPAVRASQTLAQGRTESDALITRTIPRTKESVPAIGLGTFLTFDGVPGGKRDHLEQVVRRFWEAGGRVVDTSGLYGMAEVNLGDLAAKAGITDGLFVADKVWATGDHLADDSHADRSLRSSQERLWRDRIDLVQCHSLVNVDVVVPLLRAWKKEGRIRFVGVTHHEPAYFGVLADWIDRGDLDFVQVHYSVHERRAEDRVLQAARDRGTAVLVNMPLEKGRLHRLVDGRPLPAFARELGIDSWAQYFLKWVISNPAVTCAIPATSDPDHLSENVSALRGPLPDPALRARMVRHLEGLPGFDRLASMPWYPGKKYPGLVSRAQAALRERAGG